MAKKATRRSARAKKKATPNKPVQNNLSDTDGEITAHVTYPDVEKVAATMFEARDQEATWSETRSDALESIKQLLVEHGHEGPYFFDHGGNKYKLEVQHKDKLSVAKCTKKELELAEV